MSAPRWLVLTRVACKAAETSARLLWESASRPRATSADEIPAGPAAITREWLESVLCRDHPGVRIVSFRELGRSSGSSVRRRLGIEYDERGREVLAEENGRRGGLPPSVFAKMTSTFSTRMAHGVSQTMAAEACFFREIRRHLELEAPWGYHGAADLGTFRSIQVMEDVVATRGATFCSPDSVISRERAEDAIGVLAAIHAPFSGDRRLDTEYTALKTLPGWYELPIVAFDLEGYHEQAMTKATHVIPPAVTGRRGEVWTGFLRAVALHDSLPQTLIHSDVHIGNWYVTDRGRMGLCDWGCVAKGHWSRDLAYALSTMLRVEDRRAWERELVALYLDRLGAAGGPAVSFDEAWLRYRQQMFIALLMWTPTLCHSRLLPDMQPEAVAMEMIARISTALGDLESLDAIRSA